MSKKNRAKTKWRSYDSCDLDWTRRRAISIIDFNADIIYTIMYCNFLEFLNGGGKNYRQTVREDDDDASFSRDEYQEIHLSSFAGTCKELHSILTSVMHELYVEAVAVLFDDIGFHEGVTFYSSRWQVDLEDYEVPTMLYLLGYLLSTWRTGPYHLEVPSDATLVSCVLHIHSDADHITIIADYSVLLQIQRSLWKHYKPSYHYLTHGSGPAHKICLRAMRDQSSQ